MQSTADVLSTLSALDWSDLEQVHGTVAPALEALSRPETLRGLLQGVADDAGLLARCERFRLFEKVVLFHSPRLRLRLHLFGEEEIEEVHNHRAPFAARVLQGSYLHYLYGDARTVRPRPAPPYYLPMFTQRQTPGTSYVIHEQMLHSTRAEPNTITLMLQGPAALDQFDILDLKSGEVRTRVGGASMQGPQEPGESPIGPDRVREIIELVSSRGLA